MFIFTRDVYANTSLFWGKFFIILLPLICCCHFAFMKCCSLLNPYQNLKERGELAAQNRGESTKKFKGALVKNLVNIQLLKKKKNREGFL